MIGSLRGKLIDKRPNQVLLEVGGVGYQVQIPLSTFAGLGALHAETLLLIHTHVREDQFSLVWLSYRPREALFRAADFGLGRRSVARAENPFGDEP